MNRHEFHRIKEFTFKLSFNSLRDSFPNTQKRSGSVALEVCSLKLLISLTPLPWPAAVGVSEHCDKIPQIRCV